jgi:hypothetical protein
MGAGGHTVGTVPGQKVDSFFRTVRDNKCVALAIG